MESMVKYPSISSIILCAGKSSRLKNYKKKSKVLIPLLNNKNSIDYNLDLLKNIKLRNVFVNTHRNASEIKNYFKKYNYKTVVMAASFRNKDEILNLAGCDKLTISPALLEELNQMMGEVEVKLNSAESIKLDLDRINVNESSFRWHLNENQMASFKLAEGIRLFNKDMVKLKNLIHKQL